MKLLFSIMTYLSAYCGLIPILFFIPFVTKFKTLSPALKVLFFYCFYSIANEFMSMLTNRGPNLYLLNIYTYVELVCIAVIYYRILDNKANFLWLCGFIAAYTIFFILSCFVWGHINSVQNLLLTVESISIIMLSTAYFSKLITSGEITELTDYYFFWMNTAFLVYFAGSLVVFLFLKHIQLNNATQAMRSLWIVHLFFNIIYNILLAKSIHTWKKSKT